MFEIGHAAKRDASGSDSRAQPTSSRACRDSFKPIENAIRTCCCRQCKATLLTWSRLCGTVRLTCPLSVHRSENAKLSHFIRSSLSRCGSSPRLSTRNPPRPPRHPHPYLHHTSHTSHAHTTPCT